MSVHSHLQSVCAALVVCITISAVARADVSPTQAYRMNLEEPRWFVEISAESFRYMTDEVDRSDPLQATMKRIELGFSKLLYEYPTDTSLGFHWHEVDEKSMCRLFRVVIGKDSGTRQLVVNEHFATIEPKRGSCKDNGRHLLEFAFDVRERAVLSTNAVWGMMLPAQMIQLKYVPSFAYVDTVPVAVGMLPIAQKVIASQSGVPTANWKEWLYGEVNKAELAQFAAKWQGIQAGGMKEIVEVGKWTEWLEILPQEIVTTVEIEGWSEVVGYADTPAVSVKAWQAWVDQEPLIRKRVFLTSNWQEVGTLDKEIALRLADEEASVAMAAARVSENVYGTPAYGTLIATICPGGFLEGRTTCILPEFDKALAESVYGQGLTFLRVPFLEVGQ